MSVSSPPRLKYILITYHHSAGYQQGYWDSLFVLEGGDSWGNEDRMQEAINYFSIILKPLWWQLLQNQSFLFSFLLSPFIPQGSRQFVTEPELCKYQNSLPIYIQYQNSIPKYITKIPAPAQSLDFDSGMRSKASWRLRTAQGCWVSAWAACTCRRNAPTLPVSLHHQPVWPLLGQFLLATAIINLFAKSKFSNH